MNNKIIHYCWFGKNPLPEKILLCIESWKKFCPDFKIKCWDETTFDVSSTSFTQKAYQAQKWAFVSDYVRCYALYHDGGLYFDTDVELIKSIDDLLDNTFMGFETADNVAPGLILYAKQPHLPIYQNLLQEYEHTDFDLENLSDITSPLIFTKLLVQRGLCLNNSFQIIDDIYIYPSEYFNPCGAQMGGIPKISENTRSIHHYDASWMSTIERQYFRLKKDKGNLFGRLLFTMMHPIIAFKKMSTTFKRKRNFKK